MGIGLHRILGAPGSGLYQSGIAEVRAPIRKWDPQAEQPQRLGAVPPRAATFIGIETASLIKAVIENHSR